MEIAVEDSAGSAAGILLFRHREDCLQVLLFHPGGPYWATKELGAWSIPKAAPKNGERLLDTAARDLQEETGITAGYGSLAPLGAIRHRSGKVVYAWALEHDWDPSELRSETFTAHWPPHSPLAQTFPEVDRAQWFSLPEARRRILPGQVPLLDALEEVQTIPAVATPAAAELCES